MEWAEYTTYQVFIQWLRVDHQQYRFVVEHTTRVHELDDYHILEAPRRLATGPITPNESFEVIAIPATTDTDEYFTITPHPDHTYSLTRSSALRRHLPLAPLVTGVIGVAIGILVTYAKLRSRNAIHGSNVFRTSRAMHQPASGQWRDYLRWAASTFEAYYLTGVN